MKIIKSIGMTILLLTASCSAAFATETHAAMRQVETASAAMTEGEIKKVDKTTGKLVIRHEEIKNLDMPAMTMAFLVNEESMLNRVKAGDKVRFVVEKIKGKLTVMQIKPTIGQ